VAPAGTSTAAKESPSRLSRRHACSPRPAAAEPAGPAVALARPAADPALGALAAHQVAAQHEAPGPQPQRARQLVGVGDAAVQPDDLVRHVGGQQRPVDVESTLHAVPVPSRRPAAGVARAVDVRTG
jgi:hypothetical protein